MSPALALRYEDDELIVVEKPAGLHTAPLGSAEEDTLVARVVERFPEIARLPGIKAAEPGLLHRLDRETSGLVLFARTEESFRRLRVEQGAGRIRKAYAAICTPRKPPGAWHLPARIESRFAPFGPGRRLVRVVDVDGDPSPRRALRKGSARRYATELSERGRSGSLVLVWARTEAGFRHQVRAHLAYLGFPILGDPLYGAPPCGDDVKRTGELGAVAPPAAGRMFLHAAQLELVHPRSGEPLVVRSALPAEFRALFPEGG